MISRVAVGSYASKLVKGFNEGLTENRVVVYGPKGEPRSEPYIQLVQLWTPIAYPFQILRRICQDKPDVVHVQHEFGMFGSPLTLTLSPLLYMFLKLLRVRLVTTLHSLVFPDALSKDSIRALSPSTSWMPKTIVEIGLHVVYGSACRLSDLVIVHQQSQKEKLEKYYHIRGPKIALVPHGVGPTEYVADQESLSGWRSKLDQRRLMLYFGYISPRKGLEYLIDAFDEFSKQRPEWLLVLAGGLSKKYYLPYCKQIMDIVRSERLRNRVIMTGFVSESDVDALFRLCEFVVLPYTQVVGNASACNLAMGYAKPIIASDMSPFSEEIEHLRHGILFPPKDSTRLRDAIERLSLDSKLCEDIRANLEELGKKRSWEAVASQTGELYSAILNGDAQ